MLDRTAAITTLLGRCWTDDRNDRTATGPAVTDIVGLSGVEKSVNSTNYVGGWLSDKWM